MIRKATKEDLSKILPIYERARAFMKETGNPTQWEGGYPSEELLSRDIDEGALFVLESDGVLHGAFAFFEEGDPAYDALSSAWINTRPYGAIHRVASAGTKKGVLRRIVDHCFSIRNNLKIDTHKDNLVMQSALEKLGFTNCGVAYIPDVGERILFQRSNYDEA